MIDPNKLKVVELREELANRGLATKGLKAELVARLEEALTSEAASEDSEPAADEPESSKADELETLKTDELEPSETNEPEPLKANEPESFIKRTIEAQAVLSGEEGKRETHFVGAEGAKESPEADASLSAMEEVKTETGGSKEEAVGPQEALTVPRELSLSSLDHHFRKTMTEPAIYYLPKATTGS